MSRYVGMQLEASKVPSLSTSLAIDLTSSSVDVRAMREHVVEVRRTMYAYVRIFSNKPRSRCMRVCAMNALPQA